MLKKSLLLLIPVTLIACDRSPEIKTVVVPKPSIIEAENTSTSPTAGAPLPLGHPPMMGPADAIPAKPDASGPYTMLGAIVPVDGNAWFYKMSGPADQIAPLEESVINFLKSTRYEDGKPVLSPLPDQWKEGSGNAMRFATLLIPHGENTFELAISTLSLNGPWDEYSLLNINRWRTQLGLSEVTQADLFSENENEVVEDIQTPAGEARYVRLTGPKNPNASGMSAPFMNR